MTVRASLTLLTIGLACLSVPVMAQTPSAPLTRDTVRTRLLDGCVYDLSRQADPLKNQTVSKCSCYAKGVSALLVDEEIAGFTRNMSVPSRIKPEAEKIYEACR